MSKKFILLILGSFIIVGTVFLLVLRWGSQLPAGEIDMNRPTGSVVQEPPPAPKTPKVDLTIQKSKKGNTLIVRWENLPDDTTALNIFRGKTGTEESGWSLWKTVTIPPGSLDSGSAEINLGQATLAGYSFYIAAVTNGNGAGNGTSTVVASSTSPGETILWTSSTTIPVVTTSTVQVPGSGTNTPTSTATTTQQAPTSTVQVPPPGTPTSSSTTSTPQGTPYYSPQLQISGYGQGQSGTFWVQHVDQKIEIGWQNLPPQTTSISVLRSSDQNGPWATVLTQQNPGTSGAYSIQVVDDTLGYPYYYEMNASAAGEIIATYGPVYLPPVGQ